MDCFTIDSSAGGADPAKSLSVQRTPLLLRLTRTRGCRERLLEEPARDTLEAVHQFRQANLRRVVDEPMTVIAFAVELVSLHVATSADTFEDLREPFERLLCQNLAAPFRRKHEVGVKDATRMLR